MSEHIADLLKEKGLYFTISGKDYLIKCLNPEHEDSNPSCRVDKISGATHCFSCGFKTNIYRYYGILTGNQVHIKVAKLKEKLSQLKISSEGLEYPQYYTPYTHTFRGISSDTLKYFEAFYLSAEDKALKGFEDRIIFPIKDITNKTTMFLGRHTLSQGNPRYLNYPSGVVIPLYPCILDKYTKSIVLVEGIFDMLNCHDKGLTNVVCTFGTNTLQKDTRNKLLPYKAQGVNKIYIMFDGDDAGREAAKKLEPLIKEIELEVEIIELEQDTDPGELSEEYIHSIKEYINAKDSNNR
jgi:DNA primase